MRKDILCSLFRDYPGKDYSYGNQKQALGLAMQIIRILGRVRKEGIHILEGLDSGYPMLDRGLRLVALGIEPDIVEGVMVRTLLVNGMDLLEGLLITEGVRIIQTGTSPGIAKELLKSYFTFEFEEEFEQGCAGIGLDLDSGLLSQEEISRLLKYRE